MKSIKVLHVINNLNTGGAQVCLRDIVNSKTDGIEYYIYTLRPDTHKFNFNVKIFETAYRNYDIRKFFYLVSLCKEQNIDIVHAHLHKSCMFAVLLKLFCKYKVVLHEHGPIVRSGLSFSFYRLFMRLWGSKADNIIAVSKNIKDRLAQIIKSSPNNLIMIYNSIDTTRFVPDSRARDFWRDKYGFLQDEVVVGFVGRLRFIKGVDIAIEAFELLRQKYTTGMKFLIVGDGGDEGEFKDMIKSKGLDKDVVFAGFCDEPEKIINAFDLAVIPSRQEPFGLVVLELMAIGVPVVASSADGIKEIISDGIDGFLTDNTPQQIASRLNDLIKNPALKDEIRQAGVNRVSEFELTKYVNSINSVYNKLID